MVRCKNEMREGAKGSAYTKNSSHLWGVRVLHRGMGEASPETNVKNLPEGADRGDQKNLIPRGESGHPREKEKLTLFSVGGEFLVFRKLNGFDEDSSPNRRNPENANCSDSEVLFMKLTLRSRNHRTDG